MVSIILPTYNRAYILWRAINSVLSQTYSNFELLIVDDHSSDNTYCYKRIYGDCMFKLINIFQKCLLFKKNSKYSIHGDVGPHNILRQGQKLYLLDFDNSRIGHLEEDFGISLALFKYFRRDEEKEVLLRECLKIYSTVYKDNDINVDLVRMYAQLMLVRLKYLYGSGKFILNEKIFM